MSEINTDKVVNETNIPGEGVTPTAPATAASTTTASAPTAVASDVRAKLAEYGADETVVNKIIDELGVESIEELASLEVSDLTGVGMKLAKARKMVSDLKTPVPDTKAPAPTTVVQTQAFQSQFESLLPSIPSDESWLNALKTGGILKVDQSSYIAAIRAALADRAGLYKIPEVLSKAMEAYADETEE